MNAPILLNITFDRYRLCGWCVRPTTKLLQFDKFFEAFLFLYGGMMKRVFIFLLGIPLALAINLQSLHAAKLYKATDGTCVALQVEITRSWSSIAWWDGQGRYTRLRHDPFLDMDIPYDSLSFVSNLEPCWLMQVKTWSWQGGEWISIVGWLGVAVYWSGQYASQAIKDKLVALADSAPPSSSHPTGPDISCGQEPTIINEYQFGKVDQCNF